ncbi:MAG: DNA mismatch repair endonuclease MutL [Spirochaetia bacterium]|nr:DNA mismatch repair endonuclease MutL [Spirochaetia bacterium]
MPQKNTQRRIVKVLRDSVARRIAAGEVIDRPASVVRELLDNAIDAGSDEIATYIEEGGVGRIRVVDNGCGMTEDDLRLCCLPHATSKIETEDDLYRITSLGFRGEALASIATVARCEITTRTREAGAAHKIVIHGGCELSFEPCQGNAGTLVDVADLFYAIPARRRFMKTPSAETAQCKTVFLERALAFPEISFKFFTDGSLKVFLPAEDLLSRICAAYGEMDKRMLSLLAGTGDGFRLSLAAVSPGVSRRDRRYIQIYVNRRRIWEYALSQGVEYAYSHYLPGGVYPSCFVFVETDPGRVDFNIHPAKKEAKIKNITDIRRRMVELLESFLRQFGLKNRPVGIPIEGGAGLPFAARGLPPGYHSRDEKPSGSPWASAWVSAENTFHAFAPVEASQDLLLAAEAAPSFGAEKQFDFIYRGQVFGLFLIAEKEGSLYLVDQHAAHERIIYEALAADTLPQPLLIPNEFETDEEEDAAAAVNAKELARLGIRIERRRAGLWALTALPESYRGGEDDIVQSVTGCHSAGALKKELFANLACKKAIKDGSPIDPRAACELIQAAFALENPRCPHGRPLWIEMSREDLFRKVGRII